MELEWKPLSFTSKLEFSLLQKLTNQNHPIYFEIQKNLNFILKLWWRKIVLPPSSYRFGARCFLTSTTRGNTQRSTFSAAKKLFWSFPRLDEKMMEKDFLHPPIHRWSHIFRPSPRSIDSLNKNSRASRSDIAKRKSSQITLLAHCDRTKFSVQKKFFFFFSFPCWL